MFLGSSGKTHHVQVYWVRNEDGLPGWVTFCHLEESLLEFIQKNQVRLASLCLPIRLHSHTPQMNWQFSASTNIKTGDCDASPSKIIQHTQISLASLDSCKWEGWDVGVICFHGCSGQLQAVWEEESYRVVGMASVFCKLTSVWGDKTTWNSWVTTQNLHWRKHQMWTPEMTNMRVNINV